MHGFQHGSGATVWIHGTINPGITMIATDHPFFRRVGSAHATDHIPDGSILVILFEMNLYADRPRTAVIGKRPCALPFLRHGRAGKMFQNCAHVLVAKRCNWNARQLEGFSG